MNRRDEIRNRAVLEFDLGGCKHVVCSNEVEARKLKLCVVKEQSCSYVFAGEKICYKITIVNESHCTLRDIDFIDNLDRDLRYERDSFRVNGQCKCASFEGGRLCYHIPELQEDEEMVITFVTEVK